SKRRREIERSLLSITSVLPMKRVEFAGGDCWARVETTRRAANPIRTMARFICPPYSQLQLAGSGYISMAFASIAAVQSRPTGGVHARTCNRHDLHAVLVGRLGDGTAA